MCRAQMCKCDSMNCNLLKVYLLKVYLLKVYLIKVYLIKVYLLKVYLITRKLLKRNTWNCPVAKGICQTAIYQRVGQLVEVQFIEVQLAKVKFLMCNLKKLKLFNLFAKFQFSQFLWFLGHNETLLVLWFFIYIEHCPCCKFIGSNLQIRVKPYSYPANFVIFNVKGNSARHVCF